jgi:hypothetical protein
VLNDLADALFYTGFAIAAWWLPRPREWLFALAAVGAFDHAVRWWQS